MQCRRWVVQAFITFIDPTHRPPAQQYVRVSLSGICSKAYIDCITRLSAYMSRLCHGRDPSTWSLVHIMLPATPAVRCSKVYDNKLSLGAPSSCQHCSLSTSYLYRHHLFLRSLMHTARNQTPTNRFYQFRSSDMVVASRDWKCDLALGLELEYIDIGLEVYRLYSSQTLWILFLDCSWSCNLALLNSKFIGLRNEDLLILILYLTRALQLLLRDRATRNPASFWDTAGGNDNLDWNEPQMSFKVIKSGTNRKLVHDFLLSLYSNFCRITLFTRNLM